MRRTAPARTGVPAGNARWADPFMINTATVRRSKINTLGGVFAIELGPTPSAWGRGAAAVAHASGSRSVDRASSRKEVTLP